MKIPETIKNFVIPTVDVFDNQVVKFQDGVIQKGNFHFKSPKDAVIYWQKKGATRLYLIDLNRAIDEDKQNVECIREAIGIAKIPIIVSGGLRSINDIEDMIKHKASFVSVSSLALNNLDVLSEAVSQFKGKIYVHLDIRSDGRKIEFLGYGRTFPYRYNPQDFLKFIEAAGVNTIVYTDLNTDGKMEGINEYLLDEFLSQTHMKIIAFGGIDSVQEVRLLQMMGSLKGDRIEGAIIRSALYNKKRNFR